MLGSTNLRASDFDVTMALSGKGGRSDAAPKKAAVRPAGNMKRLTLDLPEDLHRAIKLNAVQEGVTMAEKLRALLMGHYGLKEPQQKDKEKE